MNPGRFAEVERVCQAALDQPSGQRAAFVEEVCRGDAELRRLVDALLAGASSAASLLEVPALVAATPAFRVGQRLGPYEVTASLGAGGMGEVYRARDTRLGRTVAIKILPPGLAADAERRRRFGQEARAASSLNHPHICSLYDIGSDHGVDFLVMEFIDGQTMADRLLKGPLPLAQALACGAQVADALAHAHRQGIVHRDLTPGNIMLTRAGAKLLDFGVAKLKPERTIGVTAKPMPQAAHGPITSAGTVVGTLCYMAPEPLQGRETDARSDIFSFGVVLHEMLTAQRAFRGTTEASVVSAILESEPPPLSSLLPETPPALERLVRRCLAKDPDARWQTAADLAEALRGISADSGIVQPAASAPRQRRRWIFAGTGALLVVAVLAWLSASWLSRGSLPRYSAVTVPGRAVVFLSSPTHFAVASDGSGVAYVGVSLSRGERQVYWSNLHAPGGWPLAGTERGDTPFLSPDGRWLGFFRDGTILKLPLHAGHVVDGSVAREVVATGVIRGACWSRADTIAYGVIGGGLWQVPAAGGVPRSLTVPDRSRSESGHIWPSLLPDGRHVLFTVLHASMRQERGAVAVLSLDTLRVSRVLEGGVHARYLPSGHLVFALNGTLLAVAFDLKSLEVTGARTPVLGDVWFSHGVNSGFDVSDDGTVVYVTSSAALPRNGLVWVSRQGNPEPAVPERQAYDSLNFALSHDGRRLAATIRSDQYDNIWICNLADRRWQRLKIDGDCYGPTWSPDGTRLAFTSNRDGSLSLYQVTMDGDSTPVSLTRASVLHRPHSWSPDGRFLAYEEQRAETVYDTHVLPLDGRGTSPWRWGPENAVVTEPAFSPDGRWLAYQSNESGTWEVWVRPFQGPGTRQVVSGTSGGYAPSWSSDGREIFYLERLGDNRIMGRRVESLTPLRLAAAPYVAFALPFRLDNGLFMSQAYAVEPGGRRVLVVEPDERTPRDVNVLNVITNWGADVTAMSRGKR